MIEFLTKSLSAPILVSTALVLIYALLIPENGWVLPIIIWGSGGALTLIRLAYRMK